MLFNSIEFAIFLPLVFLIYWQLGSRLHLQNVFVVLASYLFYGWWDWRFLSLILFSTLVDYFVGKKLHQATNSRKALLLLSVCVNLGLLGFFKYYNFFLDSFVDAFSFLGHEISARSLNIILPVGISFYTFQTLSYTIDIYKKKLEPTNDFIAFMAFVSFFPQLVAGPIERASNLLGQFTKKRIFEIEKAVDGCRQILWGLLKKIVIADNCAMIVNDIFANSSTKSGSELMVGAVFFAFQIYGDFSGYSDIAIGTSRLFGFNLNKNFSFPYFSRDIAEFWRRWHISLSTWFRDYLYIPLGGSRGTKWLQVRNVFLIFLISGFWHGANWTFIIWGLIHSIYFLPLLLLGANRKNVNEVSVNGFLQSVKTFGSIGLTFIMTTFAWIFFRAESVSVAWLYIQGIFDLSFFTIPDVSASLVIILLIFILIEWVGRQNEYALQKISLIPRYARWASYYLLILSIYLLGNYSGSIEFIYFQF